LIDPKTKENVLLNLVDMFTHDSEFFELTQNQLNSIEID